MALPSRSTPELPHEQREQLSVRLRHSRALLGELRRAMEAPAAASCLPPCRRSVDARPRPVLLVLWCFPLRLPG